MEEKKEKILYRLYAKDNFNEVGPEIDNFLSKILETALKESNADTGSLILFTDERCKELYIRKAIGLNEEIIKNTIIKVGEGIAGWVAHEGKPLLLLNKITKEDSRFKNLNTQRKESPHSAICLPLKIEESVIGVLSINRRNKEDFTSDDLEKLQVFAQAVSIAFENVLLHFQDKERIKELTKLNSELEEKNEKLKQMQFQLIQQEKMASIGILAAGIAHEINNPIGFIHSNLSTLQSYISKVLLIFDNYRELENLLKLLPESNLIRKKYFQIEELKQKLRMDYVIKNLNDIILESLQGTTKIAEIVKGLLSFSRKGEEKKEVSNINKELENTIKIVWNQLKYKVSLHKEYGDIPDIEYNPVQITQVFTNILLNAVQAIKDKGEIFIKTYYENDFVNVKIKDTGIGIPKENLSKIFDPFFTTKPVGEGTGLGLSISYDIIKKHKGEILVESKEGEGTTFTISLPTKL